MRKLSRSRWIHASILAGVVAAVALVGASDALRPSASAATIRARTLSGLTQQDRLLSAWIATWDGGASYRDVLRHASRFWLASPYWYLTTDDPARIGMNAPAAPDATRARWVQELHARGLTVIATVGSRWDADTAERVFTDPTLTREHVDALLSLVRRDRLDGLDLDYEGFRWPRSREQTQTLRAAYAGFVAELCRRLHAGGKGCTVTLGPATSASSAGVLDYHAIGRAADLVRLMCYDLHNPATAPGPNATLSWTEQVLRYATSQIPAAKLELDVPTFGYQWPAPQGGDASLTWEQARTLIRLHSRTGSGGYSRRAGEAYFRWREHGTEHTIWYENARSLAPKVALANRYRVGSVGFWILGHEDPRDWQTLLGLHGR